MMMDCSQCPIHPQLKPVFHEFAKKHAETIAAYGARPILFMSWAYKDKPEMTAQLAEQYTIAGKANGAQVVPAGLAFAKSIARKPALELYVADKRHPSLAGPTCRRAQCTPRSSANRRPATPRGRASSPISPQSARGAETVQEYSAK